MIDHIEHAGYYASEAKKQGMKPVNSILTLLHIPRENITPRVIDASIIGWNSKGMTLQILMPVQEDLSLAHRQVTITINPNEKEGS